MLNITTNNHWRPLKYGWELSSAQLAEFDYIDGEEITGHAFIKYKGQVYDLGEFMRVDNVMTLHHGEFKDWHGYRSDSFFSGLLVRLSEDEEAYQIARYYS